MRMNQFFVVAFSVFLISQVCSSDGFSQHFVFIPTYDMYGTVIHLIDIDVDDKDEIAVFALDDAGQPMCAGAVVLTDDQTDVNLAAWQDEPQTAEKDGFVNGEIMQFRFWDDSEQLEFHTSPEYIVGSGE